MSNSPIAVIALPTFARNISALKKKYRTILKDVQPVIEQLENGETPGDQIPGIGHAVFKVRVRNTDVQRGKSGGYRMIYYLKTATSILLLTLYSKSDQDDVTAEELKAIIKMADRENSEKSQLG
jgi:mRNA-degrading endonuclease RelE of RelBE toxin-antitoxin system